MLTSDKYQNKDNGGEYNIHIIWSDNNYNFIVCSWRFGIFSLLLLYYKVKENQDIFFFKYVLTNINVKHWNVGLMYYEATIYSCSKSPQEYFKAAWKAK